MTFKREVEKKQILGAFKEGFENNSRADLDKLLPGLAQLDAVMKDLKAGDVLEIAYLPGAGSTVTGPGGVSATVEGKVFADGAAAQLAGGEAGGRRPQERDAREVGPGVTEALVVLCTAPTVEVAAALARALVEARLAACGNVVPGLRSIYRWQGQVEDQPEVLLVLKTTRERFPALRDELLRRHPYEVPEVLALPVEAGSATYLEWLAAQVG